MTKHRVALIGYGYWGKKLFGYLKENQASRPVFVHFRSLKKMPPRQIAAEYGPEFIPSCGQIWEDTAVDSVILATPIDSHYRLVKEALSRGKHVLCEKPLALRRTEAEELRSLARRKGLVLMTDYTYTFSRAVHKALAVIRDNGIGTMEKIAVRLLQPGRFTGFDVFALLGVHALSVIGMTVDLDACVFKDVKPSRYQDGLVSEAAVHFEKDHKRSRSRVSGEIRLSLHHPQKEKTFIFTGSEGEIRYSPLQKNPLMFRRTAGVGRSPETGAAENSAFDEGHNLRFALEEFFAAVNGERADNLDFSVAVTGAMERIVKKASRGKC